MQRSIFPFTFEVRPDGQQFVLRVEFDPAFFPVVEATKLLERIAHMASLVANDPATKVESLTILTMAETQMPPPAETGPVLERTASSIQEKIASVIAKQPLALAIEGPNDTGLSFAELESCASLLAEHLRSEDPPPRGRVGICLTPTPWIPVAVLRNGSRRKLLCAARP